MQPCPDKALVSKYNNGNDQAFAEIVKRYDHSLWWVARKYVHTDTDARDVLQEAYLRASLNLHAFRADASLRTWLHRLVQNAGYDFNRTRYRYCELSLLDDDSLNFPHQTYDPLCELERTLALNTMLSSLNEQQRLILVMVDILGYSIYQTADDLGISAGTLKSRRSRAKKHLRTRHPELVGM